MSMDTNTQTIGVGIQEKLKIQGPSVPKHRLFQVMGSLETHRDPTDSMGAVDGWFAQGEGSLERLLSEFLARRSLGPFARDLPSRGSGLRTLGVHPWLCIAAAQEANGGRNRYTASGKARSGGITGLGTTRRYKRYQKFVGHQPQHRDRSARTNTNTYESMLRILYVLLHVCILNVGTHV